MKTCTTCKVEKPLIDYYNSKFYPDGKGYRCKSCDTIARTAYEKRHKQKRLENQRRANRRFKYGLEDIDYFELVARQDCKCAICSIQLEYSNSNRHKANTLCIDHCHSTGKVRGLLCSNCNRALGLFKDNIDFIKSAIKYLENG